MRVRAQGAGVYASRFLPASSRQACAAVTIWGMTTLGPQPNPLCGRLWHLATPLALLLFSALGSVGCADSQVRVQSEFWSQPAADPDLQFEPALPLPAAVTVSQTAVQGLIRDHGKSRRGNDLNSLEIQTATGSMTLHYKFGADRRLPLQAGQRVRLLVWQKLNPDKQLQAISLLVQRLLADDTPLTLAVLDASDLVPRDRLPRTLTMITPTEAMVWQTSERGSGDCTLATAHQSFATGVTADTTKRNSPQNLHPPGAHILLQGDEGRWDIVLHDNRRTLATTCVPEPPAYWSWSAVRIEGPATRRRNGTKQAQAGATSGASDRELLEPEE